MSNRNEQVYSMAQDWIRWLDTRRFFAQPAQKNILAMMIGERRPSRGEPDGIMSAELAAFNLSVTALEIGKFVPFVAVYCDYRPRPVKTLAYELGIGRDQFYTRAHTAADDVIRNTRQLVEMNRMLRGEVSGFYPAT